jgi:hypothetical protein
MSKQYTANDEFECGQDPINVTSNNRPDTDWKEIDLNGHVHQWYMDGKPATSYRPMLKYETPTMIFVKDDVGYYPDGGEYDIGHYECVTCHLHIGPPKGTPDTYEQYISGLRWFKINGESVSGDIFKQRLEEAQAKLSGGNKL